VVRNRVHDLHTTRTWDFMQVNPSTSGGIFSDSRFGEDSIIGVLDTGEAILSSLLFPEAIGIRTHICNAKMDKILVCTVQGYGRNQPVLEMMASARSHNGGEGNVSLETDSMLLTATGNITQFSIYHVTGEKKL
jgi:hypothetical protein